MSGPKCDEYELTEEERKRQQRLYEERLKCEREEKRRIAEEKRRKAEEERKRREEEERQRVIEFDNDMDETLAELAELRIEREEKTHKEQVRKLMDEFFQVYEEYLAVAESADRQADTFVFDEKTAQTDIHIMRELIEKMKSDVVEQMCQQEVNRIVNENIANMGYEILGEKHSSGKASAVLYQYSDDIVIHVINTGSKFVMEVVKADKKDRKVTSEEKDALVKNMGQFCGDYEKITDRLDADSRLRRKQVYHMQPDAKYAHVVNTSSYEKKRNPGRYKKQDSKMTTQKKDTMRSNK